MRDKLPLSTVRMPLAVTALTAWMLCSPLAGQEAIPRASFLERLEVNLVNVEVFVTDKKGEPITGLTAGDFEVFEDGKPVALSNFHSSGGGISEGPESSAPLTGTTAEGLTATEAPGTESPGTGSSGDLVDATDPGDATRHVVVLIDNFNIHPHHRKQVLDELWRFARDDLIAGSRFMVASYDGYVNVRQPFTNDGALLHAALEDLEELSGPALARHSERTSLLRESQQVLTWIRQANSTPDPQSFSQQQDLRDSMKAAEESFTGLMQQIEATSQRLAQDGRDAVRALTSFLGALAPLPGRKALVYVSDGVAMRPGEEMYWAMQEVSQQGRKLRFRQRQNNTGTGGDGTGAGGAAGGGGPDDSFDSPELPNLASYRTRSQRHSLARSFDELTALANTHQVSFYTVDARGSAGGLTSAAVEGRLGAVYSAGLRGVRDANLWETLDVMSSQTGGLTLTGNDVQSLLVKMRDDFSRYYSLGYAPPNPGDGQRHKIKIEVKRRGAKLRYRRSYVDRPLESKVEDLTTAALLLGLGDNPHGIAVETLAPIAGDKKGQVTVPTLVKIPLAALALLPRGDVHACDARIYLSSRSSDGLAGPVHQVPFSIEVPNADLGKIRGRYYTARMDMILPPGEQTIAVGFWDEMASEGSFLRHRVAVEAVASES